jgi:capsular exopolysaccharide synthesis family protein
MAEGGSKVLFIDADLRKSVLIGRYKINKAIKGLTHYLSGVERLDSIRYRTNIDNLDMILSGPVPPNPAELLDNERFTEMLRLTRNAYDYVIIDTPPIGQVIDPAIVAQQTDGVIFLISQANVSYKYVQKQIEQLKKSGCRLLGAVLNKVDPDGKGAYYSGYYGKYYKRGYGYGYGSENYYK